MHQWVAEGLIPGASLRVLHQQRLWFACDAGYTSTDRTRPVGHETMFDLASLTKVTATLPAVLLLLQEGRLRLDDSLGMHFPDCPADKRHITVFQLLTHTSGLPADLEQRRRDSRLELPTLLYGQKLLQCPGERVVYSDLGMIWLGLLVERIAGEALGAYVNNRVFAALGMESTCFCPDRSRFRHIAATEFCPLAQAYIVGEVHDEKAYAMGGAAGHAGLFSTADDLCRYASLWLYGDSPLIEPRWRELAGRCWTMGKGGFRGLAWETNAGEDEISCGGQFSPTSYGHTGFTGTSMWIDPCRDVAVIFLTNAVHLGRDNTIRRLRPLLHDAIMTQLFGSGK